jgi:hypothetical protein
MKETQNTIIYARFSAVYCQKCAFVMVLQRFFLISSTLSKMLFPEGADSPSFILVSLSAPYLSGSKNVQPVTNYCSSCNIRTRTITCSALHQNHYHCLMSNTLIVTLQ